MSHRISTFTSHDLATGDTMTNLDSTELMTIQTSDLDTVSGGVNWGQAFDTAKSGAEVGAAAGGAIGTVAGGVVGAGAGAVAVPGVGSVPGWVAGGAAGAGIGAAFGSATGYVGGLAKGIWDTWGQ